MSAEITIKTTNPNEISITAEITMPLKDWQKLRDQLSTDYPSWEFGVRIRSAIERAQLHYQMEEKHSDGD